MGVLSNAEIIVSSLTLMPDRESTTSPREYNWSYGPADSRQGNWQEGICAIEVGGFVYISAEKGRERDIYDKE